MDSSEASLIIRARSSYVTDISDKKAMRRAYARLETCSQLKAQAALVSAVSCIQLNLHKQCCESSKVL